VNGWVANGLKLVPERGEVAAIGVVAAVDIWGSWNKLSDGPFTRCFIVNREK
jgi:hypothetical protein